MAFDYSTLIIDRAASDSDALRALVKKPMSQWTAAEAEAFTAATLKGSYDYTDLNRVSACMEDLVARLNGLGYQVPGYERVKIQRTVKPSSRLPEGYTEVQYIQSSGTQWVNSGVFGSQKTRIDAEYSTTAMAGAIIGADSSWGSRMCTIEVHFAAFGSSNYHYNSAPSGRHLVSLNQGALSLDGQLLTTMSGTFTTPVHLSLFALNRNGSVQEYGSVTLYSLKIFDDGTLVRDFVPCIDPSEEVGLYDLVTQVFFENAGAGAFVAGAVAAQPAEVTPSESDTEELDPYLWYPEDSPTQPQIEQYRGNVAAVRAVLAMPDTTPEVPETLRKPTTDEVNTIESILVAIDLILTHIPAARRHCGVTVCGLKGVIA